MCERPILLCLQIKNKSLSIFNCQMTTAQLTSQVVPTLPPKNTLQSALLVYC